MFKDKSVSVIFPAYNEADGIAQAVRSFLGQEPVDEVVVVNNNSRDATGELAADAGARVVLETKQGYGNALQRGLAEASTDIVIMAEPDGTFVAEDVHKLLAYSDNFEMVLGTRTTQEMIFDEANMGFFLRVGNLAVAKLLEVLYNTPSLSDVGCTMRLIHKPALERFREQLTVGSSHFLPEMVILAHLAGVSMLEIPVTYRARTGVSKITGSMRTTWVVGTNMVKTILRYRLTRRRQARLRR